MNKRKGIIYIVIDVLDNPFDYVNLFSDLIILDAKCDYVKQRVRYIAACESFDEVLEGAMIPIYVASFHNNDTKPEWIKMT